MADYKPLYNPLMGQPAGGLGALNALSDLYAQPTFLGLAASPGNALSSGGLASSLYRRSAETPAQTLLGAASTPGGWQYVTQRFGKILDGLSDLLTLLTSDLRRLPVVLLSPYARGEVNQIGQN
jgi:hypothetical protein